MCEKVLLYIVGSLKCQCKIVMDNKKAITILHARCLFPSSFDISDPQKMNNYPAVHMTDSNAQSETFHDSSTHTHTHMAEIEIHFNNQTQKSPHYILNR